MESGVRVSVEQSNEWTLEGVVFEPSRHPHISHILDTVFEYDGSHLLKMEVESSLFSAAGLGSFFAALSNAIGAALQDHINPVIEIGISGSRQNGSFGRGYGAERSGQPYGYRNWCLVAVSSFQGTKWRALGMCSMPN